MDFIPALMIITGILFLLGGSYFTLRLLNRTDFCKPYWCVYLVFMLFFTISYISFVALSFYDEHLINYLYSTILLIAATFVFISCYLSYTTIDKIESAKQRQQEYDELREKAQNDALTGCRNKEYFLKMLETRYKQIKLNGERVVILFIDLNKLEDVNDKLGRETGDNALKAVGKLLLRRFRTTDIVARYDNDKFVVLMEKVSLENAKKVAHEITNSIRPFTKQQVCSAIELGCFIGISEVSENSSSHAVELNNAEQACLSAKGSNEFTVSVFQ